MDNWLIWAIVLFGAGMLITLVEVMVPSGGILGIAALFCFGASLYSAYQFSGWAAAILAGVEGVCVPTLIILAFKILPKTRFGKGLFLMPPETSGTNAEGNENQVAQKKTGPYDDLLGAEGELVTPLRPSGTVEINGKRISVVSDGEPIPMGRRVRVILVEGNRVVVTDTDETNSST